MFIVLGGIASIIFESVAADGEGWSAIWYVIKKVVIFLLAMIFLPLVIIFGRTKERK